MKRSFSLLLAVLLLIALTGCGEKSPQSGSSIGSKPGDAADSAGTVIGLSFPNDTDPRWPEEAAALSGQLEKEGCSVQIEYAQNDVSQQAAQIQAMIARPVACLVVAAIDSLALTDALQQAKQAQIPVIAYDRLLMQTDAVTYYVGFDYQAIGTAIANSIVQTKQLETAQAEGRSHTIEFFMGSPEDNNAVLLYTGILLVLQPYLDNGVLVCRTGRTAFEDVCTQDWSGALAQAHCRSYLTAHYADAPPDILCAASDDIAGGCRSALEEAGYGQAAGWPLITGQNGDLSAVKRLLSGHQSMTVYKDLSTLPTNCAAAVKDTLKLASADIGDTGCHNGIRLVPAFFSEYNPVTVENYQTVLIDSGIFTQDQLTAENP